MQKITRSTHSRSPGARVARAPGALLLIAALASAALLLAACGGSSKNSGGASGNAPGSAAGSSDLTKATKFAQCMRSNGLPDFPDPQANGEFMFNRTNGSDLDPDSSAYKSALQSCKSLEPAGSASNSGGMSKEDQEKTLKFVRCMRSNGVPNMPDPQPGGSLLLSGDIDPNSSTFKAARQKCGSELPAGAPGG